MNLELQTQSLMNVRNARLAERRGFSGNVREILSELFQNSQRAGATKVEIFTTTNTIRVVDNGHGIEGVGGFCKLLWMYESGYDEEVQINQQPVGVGIYSLFAHEQVSRVTLRSGGLELTIADMDRWWDDFDYYSQWQQWIQECATSVGFELEIECAPDSDPCPRSSFVESVKEVLSRKSNDASPIDLNRDSPAWGYEEVLEIQMNGVEVDTGIPVHEKGETAVLLETTYQGNKLSVSCHENYSNRRGIVNWYGQLVSVTNYSR